MTITVELVGGLHDGDIREMPEASNTIRMPAHPLDFIGFACARHHQRTGDLPLLTYRLDNVKLMRDTKTHEIVRVLVYRLMHDE